LTENRIWRNWAILGQNAIPGQKPYGNGRGHPAQLNLGDCFAYAMAKNARTGLLFKGEEFDKTDILPATQPR
jgi:ribonuclease VapC